jgi:translocation and assembly module TamB
MGPQLASNGLSGDLVFNADWDALLTDTLRLKMNVTPAATDRAGHVAGYVQRLNAHPTGPSVDCQRRRRLNVALRWDAPALARQTVSFTTRLIRSAPTSGKSPNPDAAPDIGGWTGRNPPLRGQITRCRKLACGRQ